MKSLSEYKVILWDFDGVLMDSMPVRDEGFRRVLASYDALAVEALMKYHRANGGLSRYVKFRYFFEKILKQKVDDQFIQTLAGAFSQIMRQLLINEKLLIEDSLVFVKKYHQKIPMHIVSGSDGNELRFICSELKLHHYFKSIDGSPTPKKQLVQDLMDQYGYNPPEVLLVGDSVNDYDAAVANHIHFAGYNNIALMEVNPRYISAFSGIAL